MFNLSHTDLVYPYGNFKGTVPTVGLQRRGKQSNPSITPKLRPLLPRLSPPCLTALLGNVVVQLLSKIDSMLNSILQILSRFGVCGAFRLEKGQNLYAQKMSVFIIKSLIVSVLLSYSVLPH